MDMRKKIRLSDAAKIAEIDVGQLRNWIQRKQIVLLESEFTPAEQKGSFALITARGVLRIAIVAKLAQLGLSIPAANLAAMHFVDSGTDRRMPGQLFATGKTVLVITDENGNSEVTNFRSDSELADGLFFSLDSERKGAIVLPLNTLVWHVEKEVART